MKNTATALPFFLLLCRISKSTVDLNLRQLQYVSDHLTTTECRKLITSLYQWSLQLKDKEIRPSRDREPCLKHLADWNKATGEGTTVEDLCVRLHQVGRADIAKDIAQAVYGETAREIHKFFLDNPFQATAHRHGSRLMEDDDDEDQKKRTFTAVDHLRNAILHKRFALAVVCLTLTLIVLGTAVASMYCSASCHTMCPHLSSTGMAACCRRLVATFEAIQESVTETLGTMKTLTITEALGMKKKRETTRRPSGSAPQEEQDRLVQSILSL